MRLPVAVILAAILVAFGCSGAGATTGWASPDCSSGTSTATSDGKLSLQQALVVIDLADKATGEYRAALIQGALADLDCQPELAANAWLREPLTAKSPDLARARARLAAALDALGSPATRANPADARTRLDRVLADARFHPRDWLSWVPSFLVPLALIVVSVVQLLWSIMRWPFDRLLDLLQIAVTSSLFGPAALVVAIGFAAGLVLLYRRALGAALVRQSETVAARLELPPTSADALAEAQQNATAGRYRDACHFVFLSTLLWIEEQGITRFDHAATNREHLARLVAAVSAPPPQIAPVLAPVVARFDRLWYGQATVTDADYHDLLALSTRVWTENG